MKTIVDRTKTTEVEITHDVLGVMMTLLSVSAALIGIWAAACFVGAILNHGLTSLIRGYLTAVTGL